MSLKDRHRPLESGATLRQNQRIAGALTEAGFDARLVVNPIGEPLAVYVPAAFDVRDLQAPPTLEPAPGRSSSLTGLDRDRLRRLFPMADGRLFPPAMLKIIDIAVQAAMGRKDVLAHSITEWERLRGSDDVNRHVDFADQPDGEVSNRPLYGLNIHATDAGSAEVVFGILRHHQDRETIVATRWASLEEVYRRLAAPPTEPLTLNPGDVVIFQGGQHWAKELLPVSHDFDTVGPDQRLFALFTPGVRPAAEVEAARAIAVEDLGLAAVGYAATKSF